VVALKPNITPRVQLHLNINKVINSSFWGWLNSKCSNFSIRDRWTSLRHCSSSSP